MITGERADGGTIITGGGDGKTYLEGRTSVPGPYGTRLNDPHMIAIWSELAAINKNLAQLVSLLQTERGK